MATYHQTFTADKSGLDAAYRDLAKELVRLESHVQKLSDTSAKGTQRAGAGQRQMNSLVQGAVSDVVTLATSWISVGQAIQLASQALEHYHRIEDEAKRTQVTVGEAQGQVLKNLVGATTPQRAEFLEAIKQIAEESQFPDLGKLNLAAAEGLGASGGDREATLEALREAAKITWDKPEEIDTVVGAALDLRKATGKGARENIGFLLSAGGPSRITDLNRQATNIAPAVISAAMTAKGDRQQNAIDAAALFGALSSTAGDVRGESTRTATQAFAVQLRDFFETGYEKSVAGRKLRIKPADDPGTLEGRIAALQGDDKLRKQFMENASFERQFQVPIEQLLQRGGLTDKAFREGREVIEIDRAPFDQLAAEMRGLTNEMAIARAEAAAAGSTQRQEIAQTEEASRSTSREIVSQAFEKTPGVKAVPDWMTKILEATPARGIAKPLSQFFNYTAPVFAEPASRFLGQGLAERFGASPEEAAIGALRSRQYQIRQQEGFMGLLPTSPEKLSEQGRRDYDFLGKKIDELIALQRQQVEIAKNRPVATPSAAAASNADVGRHRER